MLSIAAITGVNVWADDNYAHTSTDTALGSASGYAHATMKDDVTSRILAVAGIIVTTDPTKTGTDIDDITSFIVNGVRTTKKDDPDKFAAFINAAKKAEILQ